MKEAAGELNATVIVIGAIGVLSAFFYFTIWPIIRNNMARNSNCSKAYCEGNPRGDGKTVNCKYKDKRGVEYSIVCPWKEVPKK